MYRFLSLLVGAVGFLYLPSLTHATLVAGGEAIFHFDEGALATMNHGTDPAIPTLVLEEFFTGQEDALRDGDQIQFDHLVPGYTQIPATNLHLGFNGSTVTNLAKRYAQTTDMTLDPYNVPASISGKIGLRGMMRFVGDFTGVFIIGDLAFKYDASRINATTGRTGWVFGNNSYNFRINAFETKSVTVEIKPGLMTVSGTLLIADQMANAFFPGDNGKPVGTFEVKAKLPGRAFMPMEWQEIGHPGNLPDPATGYGSVSYRYWIGTTEVTNFQYARFLNAVDPSGSNPHGLYNPNMSDESPVVKGGLDFLPTAAEGKKYQAKANWANKPVNYVGFYDAARFCNWMTSGETETGFYTMNGTAAITAEGTYGNGFGTAYCALPSEDEWYKAAYHKNDGPTDHYYSYPTTSNSPPTVALSTTIGDVANPGLNVANYYFGATWHDTEGLGNVTTVASAGPLSTSPYGTYDQGGNQWEWCGAFIALNRVMRGGSLWSPLDTLRSTHRASFFPESGGSSLGFRVSTTMIDSDNSASTTKLETVISQFSGLTKWRFNSAAETDYRFDYSTDMRLWHRLHLPTAGTGGQLDIPLPTNLLESSPRLYLKAQTWKR